MALSVFGCTCFVQDLSPDLDKLLLDLLSVFSLGILELKKVTGATVLPTESTWCLQMSRSLNTFHTSIHKI